MTAICSKCLGPIREICHCDKCSPDFEALLLECADAWSNYLPMKDKTGDQWRRIVRSLDAAVAARAALKRGNDG